MVVAQNHPTSVSICNVTRAYVVGERTFYALRGVSLDVMPGEFVAIVGPSGSGKTTLLNLIAGIDRPDLGEVWVAGQRIDHLDENALARWRGRNIGIVFQFFQLLPTLTVLENVMLPLQLQRIWANPKSTRAQATLERVGMGDHLRKLPSELSGGEKQRVALARALINDPPILVADEPTGNLDSVTGSQIANLLVEQHHEGKTIILVTHESALAARATRRIAMLDGHILKVEPQPIAHKRTP